MLIEEIKKVFKGGNLSETESMEVIKKIASIEKGNESPDIQIAVLFALLAQRELTVDELVGFAKGMKNEIVSVGEGKHLQPLLDTCGTGGDGLCTFNVSTISALVLASLDIKIAKHGNRSITSKCGSADLLEGLGVKIDIPVKKIIPCLEKVGIAFFFAPLYHPVMKILGPIRKKMVIPTLFNSMGPLLNPIRADYQVIGLYYPDTEKIAQVLQALKVKRGMVVHGYDGMDELSPCGLTKITEFTPGGFNTYDFDPREYGFSSVSGKDIYGGDLKVNLKIAREVLDPTQPLNPRKQFVILNVAAGIRTVKDWDYKESIIAAEDALQSGRSLKKLQELIEFTNQ